MRRSAAGEELAGADAAGESLKGMGTFRMGQEEDERRT